MDGILSPVYLSLNIPGFMLEAATAQRIPTMFHRSWYVQRGGLASYAASASELGRQAARLLDKVLKGAKPGEIPVEHPTRFELRGVPRESLDAPEDLPEEGRSQVCRWEIAAGK